MPHEPRPSWRDPKVLTGAAGVLAIALITVFLLTRAAGADSERQALVDDWDGQLSAWRTQTSEQIGPGGLVQPGAAGHDLATLFDPALTEPVRYPAELSTISTEDLDATNAACTSLTSGIQMVEEVVPPPAPPQDLDTEHPDAAPVTARFETSRAALAAYQQQVAQHGPAMRAFCGSYPALVAAHVDAGIAHAEMAEIVTCTEDACTASSGADPTLVRELAEAVTVTANERIAASLSAQCYLADLAPVCRADAAEASALAATWAGWPDELSSDAGAAADTLDQVRQVQADAESEFTSAADLDDGRQGVADLALGQLEDTAMQLEQAAADFEAALG